MRMAFTAQSFVGKVIDISYEVIDMFKYIIKKILMMIPMLLVISFLIYYGMRASGVDPINFMVTPETLSQNSGNVEALRESLGLNDPLIVQYVRWLGDILHGNLGYSFDGTPVVTILKTRLPYTFELAGYSLVLSAILGIGIGIISAVRQNGIVDYVGRILAVLGQAIPQCLVGIILIEIFSIKLGWFPSGNRMNPDAVNKYLDAFQHLFLPVLTLTIGMVAVLMRYARNTMLDVLNSDYIKTARSKGIPEWKVYIKHGFRNAMRPVLVVLVFRIPMLVGGSVVIESVFSYPGIGVTLTNSIVSGDYPTVLIISLIIAAAMLVCSFLVDVLNALLDPRVRLASTIAFRPRNRITEFIVTLFPQPDSPTTAKVFPLFTWNETSFTIWIFFLSDINVVFRFSTLSIISRVSTVLTPYCCFASITSLRPSPRKLIASENKLIANPGNNHIHH